MLFDKETLWQLRNQITLNSIYYDDYNNKFGVEIHACCNFFDSFIEYIADLMEEEIEGYTDEDFFRYLDRYDNADCLWDWYNHYEDDCLPIDKEWVAKELHDEAENAIIDLRYTKDFREADGEKRNTYMWLTICDIIHKYEAKYPELKDKSNKNWYDEPREDLMFDYRGEYED